MKIQKNQSSNMVVKAMLAAIVLLVSACNGKQDNAGEQQRSNTVSQTAVDPPVIPLHAAVVTNDLEAIRQHIEAESDLNEKDPVAGSSPLITAAVFGKVRAAKALIEAGANVNFKNNEGSTPLHTAAFFCRMDIVTMLLENGADKTLKNNAGSTALESVTVPFDHVRVIYDHFSKELGPLGLKLNYDQIEKTRPLIAGMLQDKTGY